MSACLQGQVILNTRPAHQQAALTALLEADGARVLSFPAIQIVLHEPSVPLQSMHDFDVLLFVSRNAVDGAARCFDMAQLPSTIELGVIGSATREALRACLRDRGIWLVAEPPFNSETLLACPGLQQMQGRRVAIFRGQAGRNLLGDELSRRDAEVEYFEVYRRQLPEIESGALSELCRPEFPSLIVLTSDEGLNNLIRLADAATWRRLCATPWLLISERMRESALKLGHNAPVIIATQASDVGIHRSICAWASQ